MLLVPWKSNKLHSVYNSFKCGEQPTQLPVTTKWGPHLSQSFKTPHALFFVVVFKLQLSHHVHRWFSVRSFPFPLQRLIIASLCLNCPTTRQGTFHINQTKVSTSFLYVFIEKNGLPAALYKIKLGHESMRLKPCSETALRKLLLLENYCRSWWRTYLNWTGNHCSGMEHWSCYWHWASEAVRIVKIPHLNNVQLHFHIKPLHFQPQFIDKLGDNRDFTWKWVNPNSRSSAYLSLVALKPSSYSPHDKPCRKMHARGRRWTEWGPCGACCSSVWLMTGRGRGGGLPFSGSMTDRASVG